MREVTLEITKNRPVSNDVYLMRLEGDLTEIKNPGEFVEIKIPNFYLRRPISVHRFGDNYLEILYKVLGHGTKDMTSYPLGMKLDVLVGLGNGFDLTKSTKPLLIAGGIGVAPMFELAVQFNKLGIKPTILFGAAKQSDLVMIEELKKLGNLILCTDNGEVGYKGNPVTYLKNNEVDFDYYYACGPEIMCKFLKEYSTNGCLSLEARMGCGFGACMGCSIQTTNGPKRVCKEGPVFDACEVIF
jgi:dihydroorotate dehydrogenase electron transfer subunit